ncbi:MAG: type IV pilus modification protein PilV [Methylococcales bacterium]|nr:type IV pilus modification protein PilV [Methylococcales bacterium]
MKTHTGFTLIEVLIAMLLLAVGLLGLAALQTSTLRSNLAAYNHGQATQLLYDMTDRIRANNCIAKADTTPPVTCPNPANYIITDSNTDGRTAGKNVDSPVHECKKTTNTTCTATLLSTYDLIEWNTAIAATLPMGRACIATTVNGVFNLYITWDDDRSGAVTTDIAVPTGCAASFSTYTAPSSGTFHDPVFTVSLQP